MPRVTNTSALYGRGGSLELPLTSIVEVYKQGKVRTVMMLRESRDESIRSNPPEVRTARKWDATRETDDILAELDHRDIVGAAQSDRAGLGVNPFKPFEPSRKKKCSC